MTNEEAIKILERYEPMECGDDQDAFAMAIEALSAPQTDYISRADAIEMAVDVETPQGTYERAIYVDDLMALPSAETVQEWIPVSERLPEPSRRQFLVSGYTMIGDLKALGIDMARWNGDDWTFDGDPLPDVVVLAWMPLPEPYREVEE